VIEQFYLLVDGKRIRFGVGAEDREANIVGKEPPAVGNQSLGIRRKISFEWSDDGGEHSRDARPVIG
jgi:hypothetical protein